MRKDPIEFWFSIGSTYTYLTVMRLADVARKTGIDFSWHPFSVREIMLETNNMPFPESKPDKRDYMWRDLNRRAEKYGFPIPGPVRYPLENFDLSNRLAVLAAKEGWCADYAREAYRNWFQEGHQAGSEENIKQTLSALDKDIPLTVEKAESDAIQTEYAANTQAARQRGIFGSPNFYVSGELFWGDDRLEDAIGWYRSH